jgi:hypothetical protein
MKKMLVYFLLSIILMISCKDSSNETTPLFAGTWEFVYVNGFDDPHNYSIDTKNEFFWKDSSLVADYSVEPFIKKKIYYDIVGSISSEGILSAGIFIAGSQTKSGTFTGTLTNKDGSGSFSYYALQSQMYGTWVATKK